MVVDELLYSVLSLTPVREQLTLMNECCYVVLQAGDDGSPGKLQCNVNDAKMVRYFATSGWQ